MYRILETGGIAIRKIPKPIDDRIAVRDRGSGNLENGESARGRFEGGDGVNLRAMNRTGIQDPDAFDRLIAAHMRVAMEEVVGAGLEGGLDLRRAIAVGPDDALPAHSKSNRRVVGSKAQGDRIRDQGAWFVHVAKEEMHRKPRQSIDHLFASDVAQVENRGRAGLEESVEGDGGVVRASVGVGEQSQASVRQVEPVVHVIPFLRPEGRSCTAGERYPVRFLRTRRPGPPQPIPLIGNRR